MFPELSVSGVSRISKTERRRNSKGVGAPTYYLAKFSQKLHEIKKIGPRGAHGRALPPEFANERKDNFTKKFGEMILHKFWQFQNFVPWENVGFFVRSQGFQKQLLCAPAMTRKK